MLLSLENFACSERRVRTAEESMRKKVSEFKGNMNCMEDASTNGLWLQVISKS
jgi:hypothetical protein